MIIHIYTDIDSLFGSAARLWMDVLLDAGHEVEYIDLGTDSAGPLPDVGACDINILIAGIYALPRFAAVGLPAHGKHLLWMFDPLTRNAAATVHLHKTALFDAVAPKLHGVMAMDASIAGYIRDHFPALPVAWLPYLIAEKAIRTPLPESARTRDVVMLGGDTPRRREVEHCFSATPGAPQADFIWSGLWGRARDACRAASRITLNIHADSQHTYFDQFRTFEAWALGTPVVSDVVDSWAEFGITPGEHLLMAAPADMPAACTALLADPAKRAHMAKAAQTLLRENFTDTAWRNRMLGMIDGLARVQTHPGQPETKG